MAHARDRGTANPKLVTLALLFTMTLLLLAATAWGEVRVGQGAPDFTGTDTQGVSHRLSDYRGKTVVLEWTNHDCPYVRKHYSTGNMQRLQKEATASGAIWLSIISSAPGKQGYVTPEQADELTRTREASPTAVILDPQGTIGRLYGAKTTPHMYIIDAEGTLVFMGGIDDTPTSDPRDVERARNYVRVALDALAQGQPITDAATRPYGCSVKY
jgi:peroxiredoxin